MPRFQVHYSKYLPKHELDEIIGKKKIVIYFYPKDFTPGCTIEAEEFSADYQKFNENGIEVEVIEKISLLEWFANNYKKFGAVLEFITNKSQEGSQFCKGFGGIGGILRYRVDFHAGEAKQVQVEDDDDAAEFPEE